MHNFTDFFRAIQFSLIINNFELSKLSKKNLNKVMLMLSHQGTRFFDKKDIHTILYVASCGDKSIRDQLAIFYNRLSREDKYYLLDVGIDLNVEQWLLSRY